MRCLSLILLMLVTFGSGVCRADNAPSAFFLRDGDRVVFYGDSITEQQMYTRDIEDYVVTRFPKWHITFINSGWSGDTATGGGGGAIDVRLKRDVLPYKPTVVTIFLGMNDGYYFHYDEKIFQLYVKSMTQLVDTLQQQLPGVRLTLFTPSLFVYDALTPDVKPKIEPKYNDVLIRFGDWAKQFGAERHITVVELNAPMRDALAKGRAADPNFKICDDGIHPNEIGSLIVAAAVLHAWHAPDSLIDSRLTLQITDNISIALPLPWPTPAAAQPAFVYSSLPGSLDVFRIAMKGLLPERVRLIIDGMSVGEYTREQLVSGVDVPLSKVPSISQAMQEVSRRVQEYVEKWHTTWESGPNAIAHSDDKPTQEEIDRLLAAQKTLDADRDRAHAAAQLTVHTFAFQPVP